MTMFFTHLKTGHVYEFVHFSIREEDCACLVAYRMPQQPDLRWTRPADEFFAIDPDTGMYRFAPYVPAKETQR